MAEDAVIINTLLSLGFVFLIFYLDRFEREPVFKVAAVFFLTVLATNFFGLVKFKIFGAASWPLFARSYIEAGFFEELLKFAILAVIIFKTRDFNESFDLIVYIGIIALGFAFLENIEYFLQATESGRAVRELKGDGSVYREQFSIVLAARLTPIHLLVDLASVAVIGRAKKIRFLSIVAAFFCAVALHGTWNLLASLQGIWLIPYVFLLTVMATYSVVAMSAKSQYHQRVMSLRSLVENNAYLVKNSPASDSRGRRTEILSRLSGIQAGLTNLCYLRGAEQDRFHEFFKKVFPDPVTRAAVESSEDAVGRLDEILAAVKSFKMKKFDWSYYVFLVIMLFVSGMMGVLVSSQFNQFFY